MYFLKPNTTHTLAWKHARAWAYRQCKCKYIEPELGLVLEYAWIRARWQIGTISGTRVRIG